MKVEQCVDIVSNKEIQYGIYNNCQHMKCYRHRIVTTILLWKDEISNILQKNVCYGQNKNW